MADLVSEDRPGYFIMRWSWYWFLACPPLLFTFAALIGYQFLAGHIEGAARFGALAGFVMLTGLGVFQLARSMSTTMTESVEVQVAGVLVSTDRWTGVVTPVDTKRVRQVHSNPYNAREIPIKRWRHWVRFEFEDRGERGFRTLYVWKRDPVGFLADLERAGFIVHGKVKEP